MSRGIFQRRSLVKLYLCQSADWLSNSAFVRIALLDFGDGVSRNFHHGRGRRRGRRWCVRTRLVLHDRFNVYGHTLKKRYGHTLERGEICGGFWKLNVGEIVFF